MFITEKKINGIKILELNGRIDAQSGHFVDDILNLISNIDKVVIDCERLNYINSAGLREFLTLLKNTKESNTRLVVCNLQNNIQEIFKVSGFINLIELYDSIDEAIQSF